MSQLSYLLIPHLSGSTTSPLIFYVNYHRKGIVVKQFAILLFITMVGCSSAFAFEVDGFRSGMSFNDARSLVEKRPYDSIEVKDKNIEARDNPSKGSARAIFLNFCNGRLVQVQKHLQPRFDYFVRMADEKRRELGRPLDGWSRPTDLTSTSSAESNAIAFIWRDSSDFVSITYTQFSSNNQLDITHDARNHCWRIPY